MALVSAGIDDAIVAKLLADVPLMTLATGGVAWDIAPQNATKFVIVSLVGSSDIGMFGGRASETSIYLVKFVEQATSALNAKAAAARIEAALEWATLAVPGYSPITVRRTERIRYTEVDDTNARWQHWGALFEV